MHFTPKNIATIMSLRSNLLQLSLMAQLILKLPEITRSQFKTKMNQLQVEEPLIVVTT